ncbi:hypothetical protein IQ37_10240 [Chryseobacterium piperi]|uniref:Uncharacterized protein n=1 Tax=Chryseobacterium piperi TaxID=558152 RepID=A0A086BF78_9FLAO|nr:hypothetical protein [Chryseobacterium piperi]ASW75335.1 hypothetical protein CJF12_14260 [Chryseobacterium piperi]KFF27592.1 hypothetical protein IQ37_10240 [Chryseobacterium piperi]
MQNIQDLKEKIFFESKNIIDILEKINNVDELLSKQDLVDELANRISFLRLLEKNIEYFIPNTSSQNTENQINNSFVNNESESQDSTHEVTEEEAIFNNELNEIDENETSEFENNDFSENAQKENLNAETGEEEAIFDHQLTEIVESEFHENVVNLAEEGQSSEQEIAENISKEVLDTPMEEEVIFTNQLNEISDFENEPSDYQESSMNSFDEEEQIQNDIEETVHAEDETIVSNEKEEITETEEIIPSIFDSEVLEDDEILIEENEEQFIASSVTIEQGEMAMETSNMENILNEIKNEAQTEEKQEELEASHEADKRKIVEIETEREEIEKDTYPSDQSFENLEAYNQEKKIKLANIKGLKSIQSLFDDDPLERGAAQEKPESFIKEDNGSLLKTNIPTNFMEAEKSKPEFRLDLNDRIAFSKMLFGGSQTDLNDVISMLNSFKTLEEAKEYLSDLYYSKNWRKVDEYAQRLWVLVENKFL